ncbi:MAG: LysM peptidoglycan-binding domain-containing protein [Candidatus Omnitrophica bacterium]|nr:LysM peptidoglycan-binding domain-containing protein [Candidatus Omnitrophota bacterium]
MKKLDLFSLILLGSVLVLSGCVVRTYEMTRDRVDQDVTAGNRGYLMGNVSASTAEEAQRPTTRTTRVVEMELNSPIKFQKTPPKSAVQAQAPEAVSEPAEVSGNKGYMTESITPEQEMSQGTYQKYTVAKGDTLQKISKEHYGTTKNWYKIYKLNKDMIKGFDKIYPGQVINIPAEGLKEPKENLK